MWYTIVKIKKFIHDSQGVIFADMSPKGAGADPVRKSWHNDVKPQDSAKNSLLFIKCPKMFEKSRICEGVPKKQGFALDFY